MQVALSMVAVDELAASALMGLMPEGFLPHAPTFFSTRVDGLFVTDLAGLAEGQTGAMGLQALARRLCDVGRAPRSRGEVASSENNTEDERSPSGLSSLDEAVLSGWLRTALAARHRPHELKKSPLLELTAVIALGREHNLVPEQALARFLDESCRALSSAPAYEASARLLEVTYLDPSIVKQEHAAAELRLPFGTYRYQLRRALEILTLEVTARDEQARRP